MEFPRYDGEEKEEASETDVEEETERVQSDVEEERLQSDSTSVKEQKALELVDHLTQHQIQHILENIESQKQACREAIAQLSLDKERFELRSSADLPEALRLKYMELKENEVALEQLNRKTDLLSQCAARPGAREGGGPEWPQVLLCSPWRDPLMPQVVICPTPALGEQGKIHQAFANCFTKEQLQTIEKEKRWVEATTEKMQIQIASLKGTLMALNKENEALAPVLNTTTSEAAAVRWIEGPEPPTVGTQSHCGCCHSKSGAKRPADMTIVVESVPEKEEVGTREGLKRELDSIERRVGDLQKELTEAKAAKSTLEAMERALHCLSGPDNLG